jgi:Tfp pilus assembly protein PilV
MSLALRRRSSRPSLPGGPRARAGISVLETVVALTLFGTTAIGIAGLSLTVAKRGAANDLVIKRTALLQQQMNWLQAIPYDSLPAKAGSVIVSTGPFPHRRAITITVTGSLTRVKVLVTPLRAMDKSETIAFDRARPTSSPLCRGC